MYNQLVPHAFKITVRASAGRKKEERKVSLEIINNQQPVIISINQTCYVKSQR